MTTNDNFERINFLSQAGEYLASQGNGSEALLASFYNWTGREIGLKHQVSSFTWEGVKRGRCKTCFASLVGGSTATMETRKRVFTIRCRICGSTDKRYPVGLKRKTYYERVMYGEDDNQEKDREETKDSVKEQHKQLK